MNQEQRSGDQILNTLSKVGLLVALLSPFIAAALTWMETHTHIVFGEGYQTQLESAIGIGIPYVIGLIHMRRIRQQSPDPINPGPPLQDPDHSLEDRR